jgi:hypothetical protein
LSGVERHDEQNWRIEVDLARDELTEETLAAAVGDRGTVSVNDGSFFVYATGELALAAAQREVQALLTRRGLTPAVRISHWAGSAWSLTEGEPRKAGPGQVLVGVSSSSSSGVRTVETVVMNAGELERRREGRGSVVGRAKLVAAVAVVLAVIGVIVHFTGSSWLWVPGG